MMVYVVFRNGVYRHECGGVFSSFELADEAAAKLIQGENDDYHWYDIVPFVIDSMTTQSPLEEKKLAGFTAYLVGGALTETPSLCEYRRHGLEVNRKLCTGEDCE